MKKKLRILLYGDYFKDASGFAKEFRDILPTLLKKGHEVRQVALRYNGLTTGKDKIYCYPTRVQGVSGHFAPEVLQHAINDFKSMSRPANPIKEPSLPETGNLTPIEGSRL